MNRNRPRIHAQPDDRLGARNHGEQRRPTIRSRFVAPPPPNTNTRSNTPPNTRSNTRTTSPTRFNVAVVSAGLSAAVLLALAVFVGPTPALSADPPPVAGGIRAEVAAFLKKHCLGCHSDASPAAKISLESLSTKSSDLARWIVVHDKLKAGEMPPPDEPQPSRDERARIVELLRQRLHAASSAQVRSEGRVVLRRLNRTEYETTLRDLLGPHVEVQDLLPSDNVAAGFDNVSAALDVSSVHLLRYQDAAERALKQVVPRETPQPFRSRLNGREVFEKSKQAQAMNGKSLRVDGDSLVLYVRPWSHISIGTATVPRGGRYRLRASIQAVGTNGRPLPVRFTAGWDWGRSETAVRLVRDASADQPTVVEAEVELKARELLDVHAWSLPTDRQFGERRAAAKDTRPLDQSDAPALAIHWLELEGPLDEFPPRGYVRLFGDLPLVPPYKNGPLQVVSKQPREDADRLLRAFLPIAFRRPVAPDLQDYYVAIAHRALDRKASIEDALLLAYRAALCSPHFLYLTEPISEAAQLDDHAIAARLSYFFWSTYPDEELLAAAERRELRNPEVLRAQVERLLNDRRAERFTRNFAGQWLDLRQINATTPDPQTYGEFDDFLFWSMPRETTEFFNEILRRNLSVTDFVHSDWTFLNERLAKHYGIADVHGGELRRTALPADSHRGGVLTQASILKVTADGTKTSPVLRGKWVLERIIGQPPPPPPPNVSTIEPDIRGATTIREQLDKHRNTPACASCHKLIDPPGFALESFDVIGGWRDFYRGTVFKREAVVELANYPGRTIVRGPNVEPGGQTADGREFKNIDDYKRLLLSDPDQLARNLAVKLIVYGTGADLHFADREAVEQIVAKSRESKHGFRSLVHAVVQSPIFLNK